MSEIIFSLFLLVPAMLGIAEIMHLIKLYLIERNNSLSPYIIIILKNETANEQILSVVENYRWQGEKYAENIIAVNSFLSEENQEIYADLARKHNLFYCSFEELKEVLKYLSR